MFVASPFASSHYSLGVLHHKTCHWRVLSYPPATNTGVDELTKRKPSLGMSSKAY